MVNGKRRLYYPTSNEGTHYAVQGPTRIEFISRYPVIKNHKKSHPFKYLIVIDGEDTVSVRHRYKVQRSISSISTPNTDILTQETISSILKKDLTRLNC